MQESPVPCYNPGLWQQLSPYHLSTENLLQKLVVIFLPQNFLPLLLFEFSFPCSQQLVLVSVLRVTNQDTS